jgi:hypothetical protein
MNEASGFTTKVKIANENEASIMKGKAGIGSIYLSS